MKTAIIINNTVTIINNTISTGIHSIPFFWMLIWKIHRNLLIHIKGKIGFNWLKIFVEITHWIDFYSNFWFVLSEWKFHRSVSFNFSCFVCFFKNRESFITEINWGIWLCVWFADNVNLYVCWFVPKFPWWSPRKFAVEGIKCTRCLNKFSNFNFNFRFNLKFQWFNSTILRQIKIASI